MQTNEDDREPRARMVLINKVTNEVRYGIWTTQGLAEYLAEYGNKHHPDTRHTIELHPDNTNANTTI